MKQLSYSIMLFVAVVSVLLLSGQQRRPAAPPVQRQSASPVLVTPPRPVTTVTPADGSPAVEMPHFFLHPEDIKFEGSSRTARLLGDSRTAGLYVTRTFIPKGTQGIPHTHPDSRTVVVLSGTYYYGIGDTFNEKGLTALPPGSFLTEPAGVPHFTWAKDGDVILQTTAIGPSGTQIVPDKKPETATEGTRGRVPSP